MRGRVGRSGKAASVHVNALAPIAALVLLADATIDQEDPAQRDQPTRDLVGRE